MSSESHLQCRICYGSDEYLDDEDDDTLYNEGRTKKKNIFNPLISPCNCTGSVALIHVQCLKSWMETKRSMKVHRG